MSINPGFQPVPHSPRPNVSSNPSIPPEGVQIQTSESGNPSESILDPAIYVDMPWVQKIQLLKAVLGEESVPPDVSGMSARMQAHVMAAYMLGRGMSSLDTSQFVTQPRVFRCTTEGQVASVQGDTVTVRGRNKDVQLPLAAFPSAGSGLRRGNRVRAVVEVFV